MLILCFRWRAGSLPCSRRYRPLFRSKSSLIGFSSRLQTIVWLSGPIFRFAFPNSDTSLIVCESEAYFAHQYTLSFFSGVYLLAPCHRIYTALYRNVYFWRVLLCCFVLSESRFRTSSKRAPCPLILASNLLLASSLCHQPQLT